MAAPRDQADFRDATVAASHLLLQSAPGHPLQSGFSLCLAVPEPQRVAYRRASIVQTLLSFGALLAMPGGLALLAMGLNQAAGVPLIAAGGVLAAGGLGLLVLLVIGRFGKDELLRQQIAERRDGWLEADDQATAMPVEIENGQTHHLPKVFPEDIALLCADVPAGRLILEGATHRYVIYADDVEELTLPGKAVHALLRYRVGEEELSLALTHAHLGVQVLANLGLGRNKVARLIDSVLQTAQAAGDTTGD